MKIGIFGGSFNPPHVMHKNIALNLIKNKYLDKVIYVPTGDEYNKKGLISYNHRLNMLKLMIKNNNYLELSDIGNDTNYKYTYQVLDYYKKIYKHCDIYFICGTDNLKEFNTWKNYKYILNKYKLLVINRCEDNIDNILMQYKSYTDNIEVADIHPSFLSSTYLRNNINNRKIDEYIDISVLNYIRDNNLYIQN